MKRIYGLAFIVFISMLAGVVIRLSGLHMAGGRVLDSEKTGKNVAYEPEAGHSDVDENEAADKPDEKFLTLDDISGFEKMAPADKLAAATIMRKISKDDMERVWDIARDGVTYKEIQEIRGILEARLSPKEIGTLEALLLKAGSANRSPQ